MKIDSRHERSFQAKTDSLGSILDTLSGPEDRLWPRETWPPMLFNGSLARGAKGGHGAVRYEVEEYVPGRKVVFRFDGTGLTADFNGHHYFEIIPGNGPVILRHVIAARGDFKTWLKWKVVIEPLHDALLEDALDRVELALNGRVAKPAAWNIRVNILRNLLAKKRRRAEHTAKY